MNQNTTIGILAAGAFALLLGGAVVYAVELGETDRPGSSNSGAMYPFPTPNPAGPCVPQSVPA